MSERPPVHAEPINIDGWEGVRLVHDGPCVFVTEPGQTIGFYSCGRSDLGMTR